MVKKASSDDAAKEKRLNCTKCEGIFFLENKLEEHMNRVHTEVKLDCELGKLKFQSKDGIHDHTNQNQSEDKTFTCSICKISYKTYQEMSDHIGEKHRQDSTIKTEANKVIQ